jgi:predicted nucleotidyltransferase
MHSIFETHKNELTSLCEKFGVSKLESFGSICTGAFDPDHSDLDMIATFEDTGPGYSVRYLGLVESLEHLLDRHVDLLTPSAIKSPLFRRSVDACRQVIYERDGREEAA